MGEGEKERLEFTDEHLEAAVKYLESIDKIGCVITHPPMGELWIHTNYCEAALIDELRFVFGGELAWVRVETPDEDSFDCVHNHGTCVEMNLNFMAGHPPGFNPDYFQNQDRTVPPRHERIDESAKVTDADFENHGS